MSPVKVSIKLTIDAAKITAPFSNPSQVTTLLCEAVICVRIIILSIPEDAFCRRLIQHVHCAISHSIIPFLVISLNLLFLSTNKISYCKKVYVIVNRRKYSRADRVNNADAGAYLKL